MKSATIYIRGVDRSLHDMFKAACAKRGKPMREVVMSHMRDYIQEANSINPRTTPRKRKKAE